MPSFLKKLLLPYLIFFWFPVNSLFCNDILYQTRLAQTPRITSKRYLQKNNIFVKAVVKLICCLACEKRRKAKMFYCFAMTSKSTYVPPSINCVFGLNKELFFVFLFCFSS